MEKVEIRLNVSMMHDVSTVQCNVQAKTDCADAGETNLKLFPHRECTSQ